MEGHRTLPLWAVYLCLLKIDDVSARLVTAGKNEMVIELNPEADLEDLYEDDFGDLGHKIQKRDYMTAYTKACNISFDAWKDKAITVVSPYNGKEQYGGGINCEFEMHGTTACQPHVTCETIDLRETEDCMEDYLMLSDGAGGSVKYCGRKSITTPFKSRKSVFIFLNFRTSNSEKFDRKYTGFTCKIFCHRSSFAKATAVPLPEGDPVKEISSVVCGVKSAGNKDRIVGGSNAERGEFPWQAAIVYMGTRKPYCGGSLINNLYILTAAHCLQETDREMIELGSAQILLKGHFMDIDIDDQPGKVDIIPGREAIEKLEEAQDLIMNISDLIIHRHYSVFNEHEHDIALVRLARPLDLKDKATPMTICLPGLDDENKDWGEGMATVTGWGYGHENGTSTAKVLQKLDLPLVQRDKCVEIMEETVYITEYMICGGYVEGGKDACQGDSGGPLIIDEKGKFVQVGVVSFGDGCAYKDKVGVYTNVAKYVPWIRHKTRDATWARPPST